MLIQVGSAETLLDDAVRLARMAGAAGVRVNLEVWPDMIHAWTLFYQQVAAGRRALQSVGAFVRSNLVPPEVQVRVRTRVASAVDP
jgi:epsilon-lactone hydrolase